MWLKTLRLKALRFSSWSITNALKGFIRGSPLSIMGRRGRRVIHNYSHNSPLPRRSVKLARDRLKSHDHTAVTRLLPSRPIERRMPLLHQPLPDVPAYVNAFSAAPLPVLRHTVRAMAALRASGQSIGARHLAGIVLADPLMALRLLSHLECHRAQSQNHDITTIERAVMMLGVEPFFTLFDDLPTVEDALAEHPRALVGVLKVIGRARKVADYARDFAVLRRDLDVQEITVAALLHETTEIVWWIHAPTLSLEIQRRQLDQPGLRSTDAQRAVFGTTAVELQLALIRAWRLPQLLVALLDDREQDNPRVRTIRLAADFSRHLARGWDNPALPDDLGALEALLHMGRDALLARLGAPEEARLRLQSPASAS